jgi:hypothetical protein
MMNKNNEIATPESIRDRNDMEDNKIAAPPSGARNDDEEYNNWI